MKDERQGDTETLALFRRMKERKGKKKEEGTVENKPIGFRSRWLSARSKAIVVPVRSGEREEIGLGGESSHHV